MKRDDFNKDIFIKAIKLFHSISFPGKEFPQGTYAKVLKELAEAESLHHVFAILKKFNPDLTLIDWGKKIRITIGSEKFPFLKLVLQESPIKGEYGFLVDRHSEFLGQKESVSYEKELELKKYLTNIKEEIEKKIENENLPSYRKLVKEFLNENQQIAPSSEVLGTILFAEDEEDVHSLYKMEIELLGYTVCSAFSGEDALAMVGETRFNCIILDLMMPNVSGLDVLRAIGREEKCIVLSALGDENTKKSCKELGACAYIEKPVEQDELEEVINKVKAGENLLGP